MFNSKTTPQTMLFNYLIGCSSMPIYGNRETAKTDIIYSILDKYVHGQVDIKKELSLYYDKKGCPHLHVPLPFELHISFSYCRSELWAAIGLNYPIGIDVESVNSFYDTYPFDLIFSCEEQERFTELDDYTFSAAAGMWSCKEAVVKSRKSGFSDLGPLDVKIGKIEKTENYCIIEVCADQTYEVFAEKYDGIWRTLAGPKRIN